jgi:hypothetical protein
MVTVWVIENNLEHNKKPSSRTKTHSKDYWLWK